MRFLINTAILLLFLLPGKITSEAPVHDRQMETVLTEASIDILLTNSEHQMHNIPIKCFAVRSRDTEDFNLVPTDKDEVAGDSNLAVNTYFILSGSQYIYSSFRFTGGTRNTKYIIKISDLPPPVNFVA